ncbi:hypothetical protein J4Q44_G00381230 [Coregonus suidteri]|uniref:Uncharacterized protein n=1 Tax=Coregonus suidteri TaxID=861788 RepID=A0AAN8KH78_9TELE
MLKMRRQESSAREGALKITLHVLRKMNQKELADTLEKMEALDGRPSRRWRVLHTTVDLQTTGPVPFTLR